MNFPSADQKAAILASPVVELRQYTLHEGKVDALIDLFEGELIEGQEQVGMTVIGQFRDLDRPHMFVWLRGFDSMSARKAALADSYGGPVWAAHRNAANATMIDSDDVLLLKPAWSTAEFDLSASQAASGLDHRNRAIETSWGALLSSKFIICGTAPRQILPKLPRSISACDDLSWRAIAGRFRDGACREQLPSPARACRRKCLHQRHGVRRSGNLRALGALRAVIAAEWSG